MRIGTWNLAGRWTPSHHRFLMDLDCDVLLLTEVSERLETPGLHLHLGGAPMAPRRRWAGIVSRLPLEPRPDPHPTSAMARIGDWTFCSSVLPWRGSGGAYPWEGTDHATRTLFTINALRSVLEADRLVWGGDWNHSFTGPELAGSKAGRSHLELALAQFDLVVSTAGLTHRIDGLRTIDHVATPLTSPVSSATRMVAAEGEQRLSDHDAYVIEVDLL